MNEYDINGTPLRAVNIPQRALKKQYAPEMAAPQAALQETANAYNQVFASLVRLHPQTLGLSLRLSLMKTALHNKWLPP